MSNLWGQLSDMRQSYVMLIKPILDFLMASALMVILSPVILLIALSLMLATMDNPFFVQRRLGFRLREFNVVKFKTMNDRRDASGTLLPDDQRLTVIGRLLRKTSLDELPQLLSIVGGKMSFVGPRPLLLEYKKLYSPLQIRRHDVRPGISGWAQINGRNAISWKQKFDFDLWYIEHISFWLDIKIIMITLVKVLKAEGISGRGVATSEKFNGNN